MWLIDRAKRTQETLQRAQSYIVEALQWLVDDGVASRIEVRVEWSRQNTLGAQVDVYSPRTGKPLVRVGTQNVFRLPDAQAWGWNAEQGTGQWVELRPSTMVGESFMVELVAPANCGTSSAVGVTLSGLRADLSYNVSLPAGQLHVAWSSFSSDAAAAPSLPWNNYFYAVGNPGGALQTFGASVIGATPEDARAAFVGGTLASGFTSYTFWLNDPNPSDDRGGLSIRVYR